MLLIKWKNQIYDRWEQSGHIILSEHSNTGDGILAALKITEILISNKNKAVNFWFVLMILLSQKLT